MTLSLYQDVKLFDTFQRFCDLRMRFIIDLKVLIGYSYEVHARKTMLSEPSISFSNNEVPCHDNRRILRLFAYINLHIAHVWRQRWIFVHFRPCYIRNGIDWYIYIRNAKTLPSPSSGIQSFVSDQKQARSVSLSPICRELRRNFSEIFNRKIVWERGDCWVSHWSMQPYRYGFISCVDGIGGLFSKWHTVASHTFFSTAKYLVWQRLVHRF